MDMQLIRASVGEFSCDVIFPSQVGYVTSARSTLGECCRVDYRVEVGFETRKEDELGIRSKVLHTPTPRSDNTLGYSSGQSVLKDISGLYLITWGRDP